MLITHKRFIRFFFRKIVEIVKKNYNQTPNWHYNSRKHVINDVSTTNDVIWAGEQERQKVNKVKNR